MIIRQKKEGRWENVGDMKDIMSKIVGRAVLVFTALRKAGGRWEGAGRRRI